jgi:hypothetical protein
MKIISLKILIVLLITQYLYGQKIVLQEEKFIYFLNAYQTDSLQNLITNKFELIRTYSNLRNDRNTFLQDYVSASKAYNGKYEILKIINNSKPRKFLVEDKSDYFKYLKIENPTWVFTIFLNGNKIQKLNIDSTKGYSKFQSDIRRKNMDFDSWVKEKHKDITLENITKSDGLLFKLLKEYSEENKVQNAN